MSLAANVSKKSILLTFSDCDLRFSVLHLLSFSIASNQITCHQHAGPSPLPKAKTLKIQRENKGEGADLFCCSQPLSVLSSTACLLKRHPSALSQVQDTLPPAPSLA